MNKTKKNESKLDYSNSTLTGGYSLGRLCVAQHWDLDIYLFSLSTYGRAPALPHPNFVNEVKYRLNQSTQKIFEDGVA